MSGCLELVVRFREGVLERNHGIVRVANVIPDSVDAVRNGAVAEHMCLGLLISGPVNLIVSKVEKAFGLAFVPQALNENLHQGRTQLALVRHDDEVVAGDLHVLH